MQVLIDICLSLVTVGGIYASAWFYQQKYHDVKGSLLDNLRASNWSRLW